MFSSLLVPAHSFFSMRVTTERGGGTLLLARSEAAWLAQVLLALFCRHMETTHIYSCVVEPLYLTLALFLEME
jgi:hypothetical protein